MSSKSFASFGRAERFRCHVESLDFTRVSAFFTFRHPIPDTNHRQCFLFHEITSIPLLFFFHIIHIIKANFKLAYEFQILLSNDPTWSASLRGVSGSVTTIIHYFFISVNYCSDIFLNSSRFNSFLNSSSVGI